jgi:CBS domain-containing protein
MHRSADDKELSMQDSAKIDRVSADTTMPAGEPSNLNEQDILRAMRQISGYLDITPADFREVYALAYDLARQRILSAPARSIMTREVQSVAEDLPIQNVAELMARTGVSGVPVVDHENRLVGVISEKDFLFRMSQRQQSFMGLVADCMGSKACPALNVKGRLASDIMSSPAIAVGLDSPLYRIFELLREHEINRVPVSDDKVLCGIVSRDDVLRILASHNAHGNQA